MDENQDRRGATLAAIIPHFRVRDVVHTAVYYRDVLGFEVAGYWDGEESHRDPERPAVFGIVRRDQATIHLNRADPDGLTSIPKDGAYDVYIQATGIDELARDLRARGAQLIDGPADRPYGQRELIVQDCNGRVLAFGQAIRSPDTDGT